MGFSARCCSNIQGKKNKGGIRNFIHDTCDLPSYTLHLKQMGCSLSSVSKSSTASKFTEVSINREIYFLEESAKILIDEMQRFPENVIKYIRLVSLKERVSNCEKYNYFLKT